MISVDKYIFLNKKLTANSDITFFQINKPMTCFVDLVEDSCENYEMPLLFSALFASILILTSMILIEIYVMPIGIYFESMNSYEIYLYSVMEFSIITFTIFLLLKSGARKVDNYLKKLLSAFLVKESSKLKIGSQIALIDYDGLVVTCNNTELLQVLREIYKEEGGP